MRMHRAKRKRHKPEGKIKICVFVGCTEECEAYRIFYLEKKIIVNRVVVFDDIREEEFQIAVPWIVEDKVGNKEVIEEREADEKHKDKSSATSNDEKEASANKATINFFC